MYIKELKLWNFRKYGSDSDLNRLPDLIVPFSKGMNVLIGENDSGKTAIIDAIKLVLKTHAYEWIKIEKEDFYKGTDKLRIELEFSGITNDEAKHFIEWLGWVDEIVDEIKMEKRPKLILIYQAEYKENRVIPSDVKAGMDGVGHLLNAEAREYLKCTYLKALRDADSELTAKKNSRLSQILQEHKLFKKTGNEKHPIETIFSDANDLIQNYFNDSSTTNNSKSNRDQIIKPIDDFLKEFVNSEYTSSFDISEPIIKHILEKISLKIEGESGLGLGTMNRLFMAAELLHLKRDWDGLKLCMIEELEAHLHPQAQMKIIEALEKESKNNIQFILTTHSPNIASKLDLKSLIICKDESVFPLGNYFEIQNNKPVEKFYTKLEEDNYTYLKRFLDVTKSNLFFSKGVIIVEGWSEEILIPEIAKKLGYDLTKKEVSIVNVGSTAYLHFAKIFIRNEGSEMKIPISIVSDLDIRAYERNRKKDIDGNDIKIGKNFEYEYLKQEIETIDKKVITKETELVEENDYVKPFVSSLWTLEWCLLKSNTFSKQFKEVLKNIHSETFKNSVSDDDWEKGLAQVLLSKSIKKTETAFQLSEKIKLMENIKLPEDDTILYIIKAIKHACSHGD